LVSAAAAATIEGCEHNERSGAFAGHFPRYVSAPSAAEGSRRAVVVSLTSKGMWAKIAKGQKAKFRYYRDHANLWRWRLRAPNSLIIAESGQGYHQLQDCTAGAALVQLYAPGAPMEPEEE
jgi:uncharacterized protein YegP (UPF0339 family)